MNFPLVTGTADAAGGVWACVPLGFVPPPFLHLAQVGEPNADEFYLVLKVIVALLAIAALVKTIWPMRKPPIEAEYATKAEVKGMIADITRDIQKDREAIEDRLLRMETSIRGEFDTVRRDASSRAGGIHKRIDDVAEGMRGISEVLDLIKRSVTVKFGGPDK